MKTNRIIMINKHILRKGAVRIFMNMKKDNIGKIDLREMNTWMEVDSSLASKMIKSIDGKRYNNRTVRMNEADGGFKRPSDEGRGGNSSGRRNFAPRERKRY